MFDKDLFLSICEKYDVELSQTADNPMLKEDVGRMTDKEKQINLQVLDIMASLRNIMKDIESKELYNKLVDIDNQVYKIREIIKSEEGGEEPPIEVKENHILGKIRAEIKEWYWQADKQALAEDPCVVDAMVDLFIRTIKKYEKEI